MSLVFPPMLVLGLGNPDRCDDGIGHYCVENITARSQSFKEMSLPLEAMAIYHLSIDELDVAARFPHVFIFDASMDRQLMEFSYRLVQPSAGQQFTTHLLTPEEFLYSLIRLFNFRPTLHLISIKGYCWEIGNTLSPQAQANANRAIDFFFDHLVHSLVK